jgi:hypothetical protein
MFHNALLVLTIRPNICRLLLLLLRIGDPERMRPEQQAKKPADKGIL